MTRFTFIRHGETDLNVRGCFQGRIDVPLNARGLAQAERLADRLAATPADHLYSSDLLRARQTAAPLERAWGMAARPAPELREQGFGVVEGLTLAAVQAEHADLWQAWLAHQADYALPGGESGRQFFTRVTSAVQALAAAHPGQHVVVVSHGGVLDMLWRSAHRLPLHGPRDCHIPNCGLNHLHWRDSALHVDVWGDDTHLREPATAARA